MKNSMMRGAATFGAFKKSGWARMKYDTTGARKHLEPAYRGKINYTVTRGLCKGKMGYVANVMATGQRRSTMGYKLRNEGHACAMRPTVAIEKAVKLYFTARSRKRRYPGRHLR